MKTVVRFDRGELLRKPVRTSHGFLRVDGYVSRAGIYEYRNTREDEAEGLGKEGTIRRELRPDSEVLAARSRETYDGVPVTLGHPRDAKGNRVLVSASNRREYSVGTVLGEAREDGSRLAASLQIEDERAISAVERGSQELSPGHRIRLEMTPGVDPKYGRYDCIQRDITINHLAIVDVARGGSDLRLRLDEAEEIRTDELVVMTTATDGHQHTLCPSDPSGRTSYAYVEGAEDSHQHEWIRLADGSIQLSENAGHTHAVDNSTLGARADSQIDRSDASSDSGLTNQGSTMDKDEQIRLLNAQLADERKAREAVESSLKTRTDERDTLQAKLNQSTTDLEKARADQAANLAAAEQAAVKDLQTRLDAAETEVRKLQAETPKLIERAAEIRHKAHVMMGDEFRFDGKDSRAICEVVVRKFAPNEKIDANASETYLKQRLDSIYDARAQNAESLARASEALHKVREDRADVPKIPTPANAAGFGMQKYLLRKGA